MNQSTDPLPCPAVKRPARQRRLWFAALLLVLGALAWSFYHAFLADRGVEAALAEADRLDPGWRIQELQAARQAVPDDENSALVVLAADSFLPKPWPAWPLPGVGTGLDEELRDLPSCMQLDEQQNKQIRTTLAQVSSAWDEARKLMNLPRGRYPIDWGRDYLNAPLTHIGAAHRVATLLSLYGKSLAQEDDAEGALACAQGVLNTGRSFGDEPVAISFILRSLCQSMSARSIERTLAQSMPSAAGLANLQLLLEDEAGRPLLLQESRATRAFVHCLFESVKGRRLDRRAWALQNPFNAPDEIVNLVDSITARNSHAAWLRYTTEYVEIAKLPAQERTARLRDWRKPQANLPDIVNAMTREILPKNAYYLLTRQAMLRCAVVALAAERYRQATHRWPDQLTDLVPHYLHELPEDPFDGRPLRLRVMPDGLVIYSIGSDGNYDGMPMPRTQWPDELKELGFRLWNVERRQQPPPKRAAVSIVPVSLP